MCIMQRELSSFPMPAHLRLKLHGRGFTTVEDVLQLKPSELSKELCIPKDEVLETMRFLRDESSKSTQLSSTGQPTSHSRGLAGGRTVLDILNQHQSQPAIITFSQRLDSVLGGGVPLNKITEICGAPGIGKTQLCMQLAVDVQIPQCFGGVEGEAVYIDTEGSFIVDRVVDIAKATIKHCHRMSDMDNQPGHEEKLAEFTVESILSRIHYFRCHGYVQLLTLMHTLPEFMQQHIRVSLVVVDSIASPFRQDFEDYGLRTRLLNSLAQSFIKMACKHNMAVVLTNQMTTKIRRDEPSHLVPCLGESWGHASTIRVILYWYGTTRHALLYKSPTHTQTAIPYQITTAGIRDLQTPGHKSNTCNQSNISNINQSNISNIHQCNISNISNINQSNASNRSNMGSSNTSNTSRDISSSPDHQARKRQRVDS